MKTAVLDVVDFHSHVLPGADHGSDGLQTSLSQLEIAKASCVTRILATPHFYPNMHTVSAFLDLREQSARELILAANSNMPKIKLGAEVLLCEGFQRLPDIDKLCFQGTKHILVELPFSDFSEDYAISAANLIDMGYNVILAHADRYPQENIEIMIDYGVKNLQINAFALGTMFPKKHLFKWIEDSYVVMLGSDIHGPSKIAYKNFLKAQTVLKDYISSIKKSSDAIWESIDDFKI